MKLILDLTIEEVQLLRSSLADDGTYSRSVSLQLKIANAILDAKENSEDEGWH